MFFIRPANCIKALFVSAVLASLPFKAFSSHLDEVSNSLRARVVVDDLIPRYSLQQRMKHYGVPGVAVAIIKNGQLIEARGFGLLQSGSPDKVTSSSLFSAGSVSKVATAALVLRLHKLGKLDIDQDIRQYLSSWKIPEQPKVAGKKITLRMILSHTAGFNVHGFRDYQPTDPLPTNVQILNGESPAFSEALKLVHTPGTRYQYSGGGYQLAQLIVSDITKMSFDDAAHHYLFKPLTMKRSTFLNPLPEDTKNLAKAHNSRGERVALPRGYESMPEAAASGLWTSADELGQLVVALISSYQGKSDFLSSSLAMDMMTRVSPSEHGLGPRLSGTGKNRIFHHGGANDSYRAWIEGHPESGDGLVVVTNGSLGGRLYIEIRNAVADVMNWQINPVVKVPDMKITTELKLSYEGTFNPSADFPVEVRRQMSGWIYDNPVHFVVVNNDLELRLNPNNPGYKLQAIAPERFIIPEMIKDIRLGIAEVVFNRDAQRQVNSFSLATKDAQSFYRRAK